MCHSDMLVTSQSWPVYRNSHTIAAMFSIHLLILHALLFTVYASNGTLGDANDPICGPAYGKPSISACILLMQSLMDTRYRFLGTPNIFRKPASATDEEWHQRLTLPIVKSYDDCNMALVSKMKPNGHFTSVVGSLWSVQQAELGIGGVLTAGGVLRSCVAAGIGGFKPVRESARRLPGPRIARVLSKKQ